MSNIKFINKFIILTFALVLLSISTNAQQVRVIDNKGTIQTVNNNNVTTSTTAPVSPVENDLWFDTSTTPNTIRVWDGSSWLAFGNNFWSLIGNSGTSPITNFLGTTDAQDLVLRAGNVEKLRLNNAVGQVLVNQATVFNTHPLVIRANGVDVLAFEDNTGIPRWHWNLLANGLNFVESNVLDFRLFLENGGDVGINTNDPTERLDVNGKLRIRTLNNPTVTTNTILTATTTGVVEKSKINFGARWTNTDITTNLNTATATSIPIFGTEDYKDDGINLYNATSTALTVTEAGRYDIRANISLIGIDSAGNTEQRTNVNARIYINGTPVGAISSTGYIRFNGNHTHSSIHLNEILNLNAGSQITINTFREANSGTVRFSGSGESSVMINKLR